jgi:ABC-type nickel/cobalt efflux system permease component RcnA
MTGIAIMIRGPGHNFPGAIEFVIAVLVIILAIFVRMYGPRSWFGSRKTHKTSRQTSRRTVRQSTHPAPRPTAHAHADAHADPHDSSHQPRQTPNDGRRSSSKRRATRH